MSQLIIIGAGKMGQAILNRLLEKGIQISAVVDPYPSEELVELHGEAPLGFEKSSPDETFKLYEDIKELDETMSDDIIILAVKPQIMEEVLQKIPQHCRKSLFVSIAAGITTQTIENILGKNTRTIRAMPNTPALIGKAMTLFYANLNCKQTDKTEIKKLFSAIGKVNEVNDEKLMHAITAISGSGPAYLFYFAECMLDIAQEIGLPPEIAKTVVLQTISGSAELMLKDKENNIKQLRENVTSPNGTTEAAMKILINKKSGLKNILKDAVENAKKRSEELS